MDQHRVMSSSLSLKELQKKQLIEIGSYLRHCRETQGISLASASSRTHVRQSILEAIEAGKIEQLPEPVYIQGFLRRFAQALELDADQVTSAFPLDQPHITKLPFWRHYFPSAQLRPIHLYAAYLLVIAASVHSLSWMINRSVSQAAAPIRAQQAEILSQSVARSLDDSSSGTGPVGQAFPIAGKLPVQGTSADAISQLSSRLAQTATKPKKPKSDKAVQVQLTLTAQSWLRVVVDGKDTYEGVLSQGDERIWEGNQSVIVRAGNAGAVMVQLNDQPPKPMGIPGAVEEITYGGDSVARSPEASLGTVAAND